MQIEPTHSNKHRNFELFGLSKAMTASVLITVLASCGGGGSGTPSNVSPISTITSITPVGFVASANSQPLSILGTNFASGMTVNVTDKNGTSYAVDSVMVLSSTNITANVNTTITVPADNFVNVTVLPTSSTPPVTAVMGVASTYKTLAAHVQSIFDANCISCHDGSAPHYLDLRSSASANGLINNLSSLCSSKFRVAPGDPRRASSVLIDKIQASIGQPACNGNPMPPPGSPTLTAQEIQTIIDWVAGGAN